MANIYKNGNLVKHMNNAGIPPIGDLIQAGIDPKTGLPLKVAQAAGCGLKENIRKNLRILDEQDAVNRYTWYNLPSGLTGQLLERILYYRGKGMLFYMEANDEFYFLPFALEGEIDVYGRYTSVTPVPFNGVAQDKDGKDKPWITGLVKKPVYDIKLDALKWSDITDSCVILSDYTEQLSQNIIPRQILQEPIIDVMSDCIPFLRTALLNSTGVQGMKVNSQDEYSNVEAASRAIDRAALEGQKYIPIVGMGEFQDLTGGNVAKAEEFLLTMQSLDNIRLSMYGLDNGGIFQKKEHMLESEQAMNTGTTGLIYQDGTTNRQRFCDIVNSIWGLGIACEPSETVLGMDRNMDGAVADEQDQSGSMPGQQPQTPSVGGEE